MKTHDKIVNLLKKQGPQTAKSLAQALDLTTMGIRQHMLAMEADGVIAFEDKKATRGRPTRYWSLTEKANSKFDDRHEELTIQLIDSVKSIFGDQGLEQLISHREQATKTSYQQQLNSKTSLAEKLNALAKIRSQEGYMASVEAIEDSQHDWWLFENHCPICAAASQCQNFCRSELQLFQELFTDIADVSREEHIIEGARRCAYRFIAKT
ncbi:helix-turn-helix transcriptional regulator [Thalassotalea sp. PLHSN55]|uniref:helix-turn-helix transcriptional regulator n=1 Tax=Thalassotalea sp. PLHSN55 TaxID=3435888 RepID=UPI003F831789